MLAPVTAGLRDAPANNTTRIRHLFGTYAVLSLSLYVYSYIHIYTVLIAPVAAGLRNASANITPQQTLHDNMLEYLRDIYSASMLFSLSLSIYIYIHTHIYKVVLAPVAAGLCDAPAKHETPTRRGWAIHIYIYIYIYAYTYT